MLAVISGFKPISAVWAELGYTKEQIEQSIALIKAIGLESMLLQKPTDPAVNNGKPKGDTTGS